jgi:hypothetical protein
MGGQSRTVQVQGVGKIRPATKLPFIGLRQIFVATEAVEQTCQARFRTRMVVPFSDSIFFCSSMIA